MQISMWAWEYCMITYYSHSPVLIAPLIFASTMSLAPLVLTQRSNGLTLRCQWHLWFWLCDVIGTSDFYSAMLMTPLVLTQQCHKHLWCWHNSVTGTSVFDSAMSVAPLVLTLQCLGHLRFWLSNVNGTFGFDSVQCQWHLSVSNINGTSQWFSDVNDISEFKSSIGTAKTAKIQPFAAFAKLFLTETFSSCPFFHSLLFFECTA